MKIGMLAGSGQNGKTTCVKELETLLIQQGSTVKPFYSTTRKTAERFGFKSEKDILDLPYDQQIIVQDEIFSDFRSQLIDVAQRAHDSDIDYLLVDRSPVDYSAYVCQAQPLRTAQQLQEREQYALHCLRALKKCGSLSIFQLPCTPPWKVKEDGYRFAPAAKNYAWSATIECMLRDIGSQIDIPIHMRDLVLQEAPSSYARAAHICTLMALEGGPD